jgi:hypothetical protein
MCKKMGLLLLFLALGGGAYAAQAKPQRLSLGTDNIVVQDTKGSTVSCVAATKLSVAAAKNEQASNAKIYEDLVAGIRAGEQVQTAVSVLHTLADKKHYLPAMVVLCAYYNSKGDDDRACAYGEKFYEVALASFEKVSSVEACDKALSPLGELLITLKNSCAAAALWCRAVKLYEAYYYKVDELNKREEIRLANEKKQ